MGTVEFKGKKVDERLLSTYKEQKIKKQKIKREIEKRVKKWGYGIFEYRTSILGGTIHRLHYSMNSRILWEEHRGTCEGCFWVEDWEIEDSTLEEFIARVLPLALNGKGLLWSYEDSGDWIDFRGH